MNIVSSLEREALLNELPASVRPVVIELESKGLSHEQICAVMANSPVVGLSPKGSKGWEPSIAQRLSNELRLLLCTGDTKYDKLREDLNRHSNASTTVVASTISSYFAATLGVAAGVISGFVIVLLLGVLKLGKEAWCSIEASKADSAEIENPASSDSGTT